MSKLVHVNERMFLAEEWRVLGEKLRKRSPRAFEKLIEMLASWEDEDEESLQSKIDSVYQIH